MNDESGNAFNVNFTPRDLIVPTAVITSTVVLTIGAWHVVGGLMLPPLRKLNTKLEKKIEKNKKD